MKDIIYRFQSPRPVFNYRFAERRVRIFRRFPIFCSCLFSFFFFFTYSEALPALRLRRVDIFGPPVGSVLNNP